MTLISDGARDTASLSTRNYDVANEVAVLDANRYPLMGILTNAGKDLVTGKGEALKKLVTDDPKFSVFNSDLRSRILTGSGTVDPDAGSQTLTLSAGGTSWKAGDIIYVTAQDWRFRIESITSATAIVVSAELGGATGAAASVAGDIIRIGNSNGEGASYPAIMPNDPTEVYNYTQIFKTAAGATRTELNTKTYIKLNDFDQQLLDAGIDHYLDMEYSFIFGKRQLTAATSSVGTIRHTGGVLDFISTYSASGIDTQAEWLSWLSGYAFAHGSVEKVLLCGANVIDMLYTWYEKTLVTYQDERTYGILINQIRTPHGTLNVVNHELLKGGDFANYAIALDMKDLKYRFLGNSDTKLYPNQQAPGVDGRIDQYITEAGLYIGNEKNHAVMSKGDL